MLPISTPWIPGWWYWMDVYHVLMYSKSALAILGEGEQEGRGKKKCGVSDVWTRESGTGRAAAGTDNGALGVGLVVEGTGDGKVASAVAGAAGHTRSSIRSGRDLLNHLLHNLLDNRRRARCRVEDETGKPTVAVMRTG